MTSGVIENIIIFNQKYVSRCNYETLNLKRDNSLPSKNPNWYGNKKCVI